MRWKQILCVALLAPVTGCNLAYYTTRNLANETASRVDEVKLYHRLRREAEAAWAEVCRKSPPKTFSAEYADGFIEGYTDLLLNGGPPRPPAVPPPRYRRSRYLTPEGQALVKDYLGGFLAGAETAAASGHRAYLTVPTILADPVTPPPLPINCGPASCGPGVTPLPGQGSPGVLIPANPELPPAVAPPPTPVLPTQVPQARKRLEPRDRPSDPPRVSATVSWPLVRVAGGEPARTSKPETVLASGVVSGKVPPPVTQAPSPAVPDVIVPARGSIPATDPPGPAVVIPAPVPIPVTVAPPAWLGPGADGMTIPVTLRPPPAYPAPRPMTQNP